MDLSTWDTDDMKGEEYVGEKKYRQDMQNLTPNDVLEVLLDTIDKDTTVDMIEGNMLEAIDRINNLRFNRIKQLLGIKSSQDFIEEQKRREQRKQEESKIEVKAQECLKTMTEENMEKKIDIRPEDALEYLYEISDKWKKEKDPIDSMKADLRTMIRYFKEEKFDKLQDEFRVDP